MMKYVFEVKWSKNAKYSKYATLNVLMIRK